ncbi:MAG: hypothetical protein JJLCMIEE_01781 [Acidimicrobiales bacterium]|nr:MAG: DUF3152 domain-containing protein [Actinomycetota bacterium]MBV6508715.1 hypothetical protein [Acidimicrobiales bacterium]RIK08146.1 MAG: hypothetical protein DCC48_01870 [Acidobacteriota bacterium]
MLVELPPVQGLADSRAFESPIPRNRPFVGELGSVTGMTTRVRPARRMAIGLLAAVVLSVGLPAAPAGAQQRVYTYEVRGAGAISTDLAGFAAHADATMRDPRGWGLGGAIWFQRVQSGGDFTLWLAEASVVATFSPVCSSQWSCQVGRNVIINETRWRYGTPTWNLGLEAYRHYVVNHELGHWMGFGHWSCPGPGRPAPVMMQQSKGSQGCAFNVWPLESERQSAAQRHGVTARTPLWYLPSGWSAQESAALDAAARELGMHPSWLQKGSVYLWVYLSAVSGIPGPRPVRPRPSIVGPTVHWTLWTAADYPALEVLSSYWALTPLETQKAATAVVVALVLAS